MAGLGLQTDRYGKIMFDAAKFTTAYDADPAQASARSSGAGHRAVPGFAARLEAAGKRPATPRPVALSLSIKGHQSSVTTMQAGIDAWDVRLAQRQDALNRQFSALEVVARQDAGPGVLADRPDRLAAEAAPST